MITVFTNGCFDILHVGHIRLLQWARSQGGFLTVGLNSDISVRRLKGPNRPIVAEAERKEILLALRCVDQVIIFKEDTPLELLDQIRPQILVKGPECLGQVVPGQEFVESLGGCVMIPDWPIDISTSGIMRLINRAK